jgi:lipopolysaccharide/colanic/teichoic acid biosynthesis glycosyltransferase
MKASADGRHLEGGTEASIEAPGPRADAIARMPWKRLLDLIIGGLLLALASPIMAALALLIKLDSRGPVFYRQNRVGRMGLPFTLLKFRSMGVGEADEQHRALTAGWYRGDDRVRGYKSLPDPRVTRMGRVLRRTNLDELPQLFNVLRGEMSLVGPRPSIEYELAHYLPWYFGRLRVLPGITGLWQVSGRDRLSAAEMMALDVQYVEKCSLGLDIKILALTGPALLADWLEGWRSRKQT